MGGRGEGWGWVMSDMFVSVGLRPGIWWGIVLAIVTLVFVGVAFGIHVVQSRLHSSDIDRSIVADTLRLFLTLLSWATGVAALRAGRYFIGADISEDARRIAGGRLLDAC